MLFHLSLSRPIRYELFHILPIWSIFHPISRQKQQSNPLPSRRRYELMDAYSSDLMILSKVMINRYWCFHLGFYTRSTFLYCINTIYYKKFGYYENIFLQNYFLP